MNPSKTRRHSPSQSAPSSSPIDPDPDPNRRLESRDWSSLTDAALHSVFSRLDSLEDFFAFRAVCRSWRSLPTHAALSAQPPLLLLPRFPSSSESLYDLLRRRLYKTHLPWSPPSRRSLAFSHGFLITSADPDPDPALPGPSKLLLWNLLSGARIRLPKSPRRFPRVLLSSSPAAASSCSVVCFRPGAHALQFCSLGDPLWKFHSFSSAPSIQDMIFFRGRLYALTPGRRLAAVDLAPCPNLTFLGGSGGISAGFDLPDNKKYYKWMLAESGGDLLLVGIYPVARFSIFRWDFERGGEWQRLPDLGGRALFLGDGGFAASAVPNCSAVKGNCIYYADRRESVYYEFSLERQSLSLIALDPFSSIPHHRGSHVPKIWVFPSLCCL